MSASRRFASDQFYASMRAITETRPMGSVVPCVGVHVMRSAVRVSRRDVTRLAERVRDDGYVIFNGGDDRRGQAVLSPSDPVFLRLQHALQPFVRGRRMGSSVVLHSSPGCGPQPMHYDFDPSIVGAMRVKPLGVLLALQPDTLLRFQQCRDVTLDAGDVLVFDGDIAHAGAAYERANTRVHLYIDAVGPERSPNATWLVQDEKDACVL